jgi:D-alanyl-D-alanine carboxypeptidase (penicillin-binding protein 5/6)
VARPAVLLVPLVLVGGGLAGWRASVGGTPALPLAVRHPVAAAAPEKQKARGPLRLLSVSHPSTARLAVAARAAILVDANSGLVLWQKRPHLRLPVASTTKIMTAVLALERLGPKRIIKIDPSVPRVAPFREGLRAGERVPAWKLFYGLLLYSGNDDALALGIAAAGSRGAFIAMMNRKARQLGMGDSHFTSPSGVIDRGNYSTPWDMAALARYAMWNGRFRAVVRTRVKRLSWPAPTFGKVYVNKNHLLGTYRGADGIKTGWTTLAQHCLVASAKRNGVRLIAVVLHSPNAYPDARRMLDFGFALRS